MSTGYACLVCKGATTGGCPTCNQQFHWAGDPPAYDPWGTPYKDPDPARIYPYPAHPPNPVGAPYGTLPRTYYQPIPEVGPSQRERIATALLAALITREDAATISSRDKLIDVAFEMADECIVRLNK